MYGVIRQRRWQGSVVWLCCFWVAWMVRCAPAPVATDGPSLEIVVASEPAASLDASAADSPDKPTPVTQRFQPPQGAVLTYELRWSWEGAVWSQADNAYIWRAPSGREVALEAGYVGLAAMQLVPCDASKEATKMGRWWPLTLGRLAYADHAFTNDSSTASRLLVEIMIAGGASLPQVAYGEGKASGGDYCQLHVLYGPLQQEAVDGFLLSRSSLFLRGWMRNSQAATKQPFASNLHLSIGGITALVVPLDKEAAGRTIVLTRFPAKAIAAVDASKDIGSLSPLDFNYQFLLKLAQTTKAEVQ